DVLVCAGPLDERVRTLTDAIAIFEVLSDDTADTDRVKKRRNYAAVPSRGCSVLLEETAIGATVFCREPRGAWTEMPQREGELWLPGLDIALPVAAAYRGLTFAV